MSKRVFKNMYYRGTIQKATDFPKLEKRREGMIYTIYFENSETTNSIADPELGTDVNIETFEDVYTDITTAEGHFDEDSENYGKLEATTTAFNDIRVGSQISIDGDIRYVKEAGTDTIILNLPLSKELTEENAVNSFWYRNTVESKTVFVDADHAINKKLYSENNAFSDMLPGDEIVVFIEGANVGKRIIDEFINDEEVVLDEPFVGDLSSIIVDEYGTAVPIVKTKSGFEFDETDYYNNGRFILWTDTPDDGFTWVTIAGKAI